MDVDLTVTASEMKALRDREGIGMGQGKRLLKKEKIARAIAQAETVDDLKFLLHETLKLIAV